MRSGSKSVGRTIGITFPDSSSTKVHTMASQKAHRDFVADLLLRAAEDWLFESDVLSLLIERTTITEKAILRSMSVAVIGELIHEGMLVPTTFGEPWETNAWGAAERIWRTWSAKPDQRALGDFVWLKLSSKGLEAATLLAREEGWTPVWKG